MSTSAVDSPLTAFPKKPEFTDPDAHDKDAPSPAELLASQIDEVRSALSKMDAEDFKRVRNVGVVSYAKPRPILAEKQREDERRKLRRRENQLLAELNDYLAQEGSGRIW